jgi:hypothetical protein
MFSRVMCCRCGQGGANGSQDFIGMVTLGLPFLSYLLPDEICLQISSLLPGYCNETPTQTLMFFGMCCATNGLKRHRKFACLKLLKSAVV